MANPDRLRMSPHRGERYIDVTSKISGFLVETNFADLPSRAVETANTAILDTLGVALAGSRREESAAIAAKLAREEQARPEATVYGQGFKSSALQAAFANGVASHAADFDHSFVAGGQPTAPIIPAAMALGEALGVSGKQLVEAYAVGFEVTASLCFALPRGAHGWHANGVLGAFGAAAACAKLLGLDAAQTAMALGMTASMASGLSANFGTMSKPMHVGLAARNGVMAAKLAKAGYTANAQAWTVPVASFDTYYGGQPDEAPFDRARSQPCPGQVRHPHQALPLRRTHAHGHLRRPRVAQPVQAHHGHDSPHRRGGPRGRLRDHRLPFPRDCAPGQVLMPYLVARALIDGTITLDTFTEEAIKDEHVLSLLKKVDMRADPSLTSGADGSRPAAVTMSWRAGRRARTRPCSRKAARRSPLTAEIRDKFEACARGVLTPEVSVRAVDQLLRLDSLERVATVADLLAGG